MWLYLEAQAPPSIDAASPWRVFCDISSGRTASSLKRKPGTITDCFRLGVPHYITTASSVASLFGDSPTNLRISSTLCFLSRKRALHSAQCRMSQSRINQLQLISPGAVELKLLRKKGDLEIEKEREGAIKADIFTAKRKIKGKSGNYGSENLNKRKMLSRSKVWKEKNRLPKNEPD